MTSCAGVPFAVAGAIIDTPTPGIVSWMLVRRVSGGIWGGSPTYTRAAEIEGANTNTLVPDTSSCMLHPHKLGL